MPKKLISVVAGIIHHNGKYLCAQRRKNEKEYISQKWEFPGGKIEFNESPAEALIREIREELEITIIVDRSLGIINHEYPDLCLALEGFLCTWAFGSIVLHDHEAYQFLKASELMKLDWAAADIPFVNQIAFGDNI